MTSKTVPMSSTQRQLKSTVPPSHPTPGLPHAPEVSPGLREAGDPRSWTKQHEEQHLL